MTQEPGGPVDRSVRLPPDLAAWVAEEARRQDATEATIIRQAIRAMKNARRSEFTPEELAAMEIEGPTDGEGAGA